MVEVTTHHGRLLQGARLVTKIASLFVTVYLVLAIVVDITCFYAFVKIGITSTAPPMFWLCVLSDAAVATLGSVLLFTFLHNFSVGVAPFDKSQTTHLVLRSLTQSLQRLPSFAPFPLEDILVVSEPIPIDLVTNTGPTLTKPLLAVFLLCVAAILRYAAALKAGSDSIL